MSGLDDPVSAYVTIRSATVDDAAEIARVFRASFDAALPFLPKLHTEEEDLQYFSQEILPKHEAFVACEVTATDRIVGFIAFDEQWISHLYLLPGSSGRGIGTRLLNLVKACRSSIRLWAFQKNENARKFYCKHGFIAIKETDGADNEEKEPDVLFEWSSQA